MNLKPLFALALCFLTFQFGYSQEMLTTNTENFARIFSEKEVFLKVTSYGGITGGKIGETTYKIERNEETCGSYINNLSAENQSAKLIDYSDLAILQNNLLDLIRVHDASKIPAGNCVYFDKNFELYSSAGKMLIKPANASGQISNFNNWFQSVKVLM